MTRKRKSLLPEGVKRTNFSTRNMRSDHLDRIRVLAMQVSALDRRTYPIEQMVNRCLGAGLKVLEPKVATQFAAFQREQKKQRAERRVS